MTRYVIPFQELRMSDVESVGGKNASLGEMISQLPSSVRVPGGFATTAEAYREFLAHQGLADKINSALDALDVDDVDTLANRITSYNVCYTKLLRIARRAPSASAKAGAPTGSPARPGRCRA